MVRFYWQVTPETPPDLKERFIRHVVTDEQRTTHLLREVSLEWNRQEHILEIGCGTGAFLKAAATTYEAIGCDIAMRWLIVARKRLVEGGMPAKLICCCADYLPFRNGSFQTVVAISLLEHLPKEQSATVKECARVLRESGTLWAITTNRYSLAPEPHVNVWGVGYCPRRWMSHYVRWRKNLSYNKYRLLSGFELRRLLHTAGFADVSVSIPFFPEADVQRFGWLGRLALHATRMGNRLRFSRFLLLLVSPLVQVIAKKGHRNSSAKSS